MSYRPLPIVQPKTYCSDCARYENMYSSEPGRYVPHCMANKQVVPPRLVQDSLVHGQRWSEERIVYDTCEDVRKRVGEHCPDWEKKPEPGPTRWQRVKAWLSSSPRNTET